MNVNTKVMLGNYDRYAAQQHLIKGVGKTADALVLEIAAPSKKYRYLVAVTPDMKVTHKCKAASEGRPCWHLAAALEAMARFKGYKQTYPTTVDSVVETPEVTEIEEDLTPQIFGHIGDFKLLNMPNATAKDTKTDEEEKAEVKIIEPEQPEDATDDDDLGQFSFPTALMKKIKAFREQQKKILTKEQLERVPAKAEYTPIGNELLRTLGSLLAGPDGTKWHPALLIGPRSTGKSTLAYTVAHILMLPVTLIGGNGDITADWLLGGPTISYDKDGRQQITHQAGLLLQAVESGELVIFEEINMVPSEINSLLHPLLDWHRILPVPGVGQVKPHPSFRMIACMNPGYAGTRQVNEALISRFKAVKVPYPPGALVEEIIIKETGVKKDIAKNISQIYEMIVRRVEQRDILDNAVNIRALIYAASDVKELKLNPKEAITDNLCDSIEDPHTISVIKEIVDSKIA
jgi:hypothetical protein